MKELENTHKFAEETYRLMYLIRYNIYPRNNDENVANHLAQTTLLSLYLCDQLKGKIEINREKVLTMAITHDISEVNGMDIVHKLKREYPELKTIANEIEMNETKNLMGVDYMNLLEEFNQGNTIESLIVQYADVLACVIYSMNEIKLGNSYFNIVLKESNDRLDELELKLLESIKRRLD